MVWAAESKEQTPLNSYARATSPTQECETSPMAHSFATYATRKKEKNKTRFVVGGDRINYPGEVATPTAEMLVAKILFNSVISTKGARFMTMDISNFYLMTPLARPEYIQVKLSDLPDKIINKDKLKQS